MKGYHKIDEDIEEHWGWPHWLWLSIGNGLMKLNNILANYAEFEHRFPEDKSETHD